MLYGGEFVEITPLFIYEVNLYKYWKCGFCLLGNKFIKSNKLLSIKSNKTIEKHKDYFIEKEIHLIGVPEQFAAQNDLIKTE